MKNLRNLFFAFAVVLVVLPSGAKSPLLYSRADKDAMNHWVDSVMSLLSPRERLAQMFMPTLTPGKNDNSLGDVAVYVERDKVGGVLLSKGTAAQFATTVNAAQSKSKVPLLVSVDGEWGPAMRVVDAVPFPRNMALGAVDNDKLLYKYGAEVARQCRVLGINVNFAPVVDVFCADSDVLGNRPYGSRADNVSNKAIAFSRGMEDGGVLSVAKHFPGHGSTPDDSHKMLPVVNKTHGEMQATDLVPFKKYINAGLGGVLTAHLSLPNIEKSGSPASLSKSIVTDLLQDDLGFEGLIFTDALGMKGAAVKGSPAVNALKAGNDVLLAVQNVGAEIREIEKCLANGEVSQDRIDHSCRKILCYKYLLKATSPQLIDSVCAREAVLDSRAELINERLWRASVTLAKDKRKIVPMKNLGDNKIGVINTSSKLGHFAKSLRLYADVRSIDLSATSRYNTIIVAVNDSSSYAVSTLDKVSRSGKDVIAVFFCHPIKVKAFAQSLSRDNVSTILAFENGEVPQFVAAEAIFGGCDISGKSPVDIPGFVKAGTGVSRKANRLGFAEPDEVGVDGKMLAHIVDSLIYKGVDTKAFPGCQVLMAKNGKVILNRSVGKLDSVGPENVDDFTIYDLASVSKATGTLPGIMKAYDEGLIDLDSKISKYIPQLRGTDKNGITVRELLFHESAIPPSIDVNTAVIDSTSYEKPLFKKKPDFVYSWLVNGSVWANHNVKMRTDIFRKEKSEEFPVEISRGIYGNRTTYDSIMHYVYTIPLRDSKKYTYSCVNFCLLMNIEENVTGKLHDQYVNTNFYAPLGAYHTGYRPLNRFPESQIAPTEQDNLLRHQMVRGFVHDETACFSGGVQGNAGLFSNAFDLAKLCQMWLNGGVYGDKRLLSEKTVRLFTTQKSPTCRRGLGFDKPDVENPDLSPTCEEASPSVFGHLGFTGTVFWVDPENDMFMIFLCNRVYPTRNNPGFNELDIRPKLFQALYKSLK